MVYGNRFYAVILFCTLLFCFQACDSDSGNPAAIMDGYSWDRMDSYYVNNPLADEDYWVRAYGSGKKEHARVVRVATNGDYLLAGETFTDSSEPSGFWLLRLSSDGKVLWCKSYGPKIYSDGRYDLVTTSDNGCILVGNVSSEGHVLKIDRNGAIEWQKKTPDSGCSTIREIPGTGYAVSYSNKMHILDYEGTPLHTRNLMVSSTTRMPQDFIIATADGGLLSVGLGALSKVSAEGNLEWSKREISENWLRIKSVIQSSDGGYLITGATDGEGEENMELALVRLDADGNFEWAKKYPRTTKPLGDYENTGVQLLETGSGEIVIMGSSELSGAWGIILPDEESPWPLFLTGYRKNYTWLLKTDPTGDIVWHKSIRDIMNIAFSFFGPMIINTINTVDLVRAGDACLMAGDIGLFVDLSTFAKEKALLLKADSEGHIPNTWCITGDVSTTAESFELEFGDTGYYLVEDSITFVEGELTETELVCKYINL